MLTIHHAPRSRSLRIVWQCEEMGLPYQIAQVSLHEPDPAFLQVNPMGGVPVLEDGEVCMSESVAIMLYLAGRHGPSDMLVGSRDPDYAPYLQFLMMGEAAMGSWINILIMDRYRTPEMEKGGFVASAAAERLERALNATRKRIAGREFLAADRFTLADISTGFALTIVSRFLGMAQSIGPDLAAYRDRLTARPAFARADAR